MERCRCVYPERCFCPPEAKRLPRLVIELDTEAIARGRWHYPTTFPEGDPETWSELDLSRALDFLRGDPDSYRIIREDD